MYQVLNPLLGRRRIALGLGIAALLAFTLGARPAFAQQPTVPMAGVATAEMLLTQPVTTHTLPDPNAPMASQVPAGTTVVALAHQMGTDGMLWVQIVTPDGTVLGWLHLSDLLAAATPSIPRVLISTPSGLMPALPTPVSAVPGSEVRIVPSTTSPTDQIRMPASATAPTDQIRTSGAAAAPLRMP